MEIDSRDASAARADAFSQGQLLQKCDEEGKTATITWLEKKIKNKLWEEDREVFFFSPSSKGKNLCTLSNETDSSLSKRQWA